LLINKPFSTNASALTSDYAESLDFVGPNPLPCVGEGTTPVIPAKAGIHVFSVPNHFCRSLDGLFRAVALTLTLSHERERGRLPSFWRRPESRKAASVNHHPREHPGFQLSLERRSYATFVFPANAGIHCSILSGEHAGVGTTQSFLQKAGPIQNSASIPLQICYFDRICGFPKFTNEVQHQVKVLSWETDIRRSPLKSGVSSDQWSRVSMQSDLPAYKPRVPRSGKSPQVWTARHLPSLGR